MISEYKFKEVANQLGVEVAVLKAVAEVESNGSGFLPTGEPKILFEPHKFWANLKKRGIDPNKHTKDNTDILYPTWKSGSYGKESQQHSRLARAASIDREAALESASWGGFQVMGENWKSIGYPTLQAFINDAYESEDTQFNLFVAFIKSNNLLRYLKSKEWRSFAKGYNGAGYEKNNYHTKLENAYKKYSK